MIWHIFKKDFKLAWRFAALFAGLEFLYVILLILEPIKIMDPVAEALQSILQFGVVAAGALLIARLSHQDAIPGVRQDWLVRPIDRKHLLAAKLLAVVVLVHGPMLVADTLYNWAAKPVVYVNPHSFGQALAVAVGHGAFVLLTHSLPLLALCSIARNIGESIGSGVVLFLGVALGLTITRAFYWEFLGILNVADGTGLSWIPTTAGYLVNLAGAIAVLFTQFFYRKTLVSRAIVGGVWIVFGLVTAFFPWQSAFAIERQLATQKGLGSGIKLNFDPSMGRAHRTPARYGEDSTTLYVPLRVEGLPPDTVLRVEMSDSVSIAKSGKTRLFSRDRRQDFHSNGPAHLKLGLEPLTRNGLEGPLNNPETRDQPFQLEIDLSMTLLRLQSSTELPAMMGRRAPRVCIDMTLYMSEAGPFEEEGDPRDVQMELICSPIIAPKNPCVSLELNNLPPPFVQRPSLTCFRSYSPLVDRLLPGGDRVAMAANFYDPNGVLHYEDIDFGLYTIRSTIRWYKPVDHFIRKIVIPDVRLKDWIAETP